MLVCEPEYSRIVHNLESVKFYFLSHVFSNFERGLLYKGFYFAIRPQKIC